MSTPHAAIKAKLARYKEVCYAIRLEPMKIGAIAEWRGLSIKGAQSMMGRMKAEGLAAAVRVGLAGCAVWTTPDRIEAVTAVLRERQAISGKSRNWNERRRRERRVRPYRIDPEAVDVEDLPIRRLVVTSWEPEVKRGPSSVFELGSI